MDILENIKFYKKINIDIAKPVKAITIKNGIAYSGIMIHRSEYCKVRATDPFGTFDEIALLGNYENENGYDYIVYASFRTTKIGRPGIVPIIFHEESFECNIEPKDTYMVMADESCLFEKERYFYSYRALAGTGVIFAKGSELLPKLEAGKKRNEEKVKRILEEVQKIKSGSISEESNICLLVMAYASKNTTRRQELHIIKEYFDYCGIEKSIDEVAALKSALNRVVFADDMMDESIESFGIDLRIVKTLKKYRSAISIDEIISEIDDFEKKIFCHTELAK